jgi:RNA polymerase sigma-70 factor (ECF subfamily)
MQTDLVRRAMRGDHDAFVTIVEEALPGLYASACHILHDEADAEEAVQEATIRAWRSISTLRDPERLDAWLYRLLMHACMDEARGRSRVRRREERAATAGTRPTGDDLDAVSDRDELMSAMRRLTLEQRAVVVLVYYRGYSLSAAADVLGAPLGTVKSRLNRALAGLRLELEPGHEADGSTIGQVLP